MSATDRPVHPDFDGPHDRHIQCPRCAKYDYEHADYPPSLRHDGDSTEYECDCGAVFQVWLCVEYTYTSSEDYTVPTEDNI